jgi:DNA-binding beta-propeller fold protein YncE
MRKFIAVAFLLCLACSSYGLHKESAYQKSDSPAPVKGLKLVGSIGKDRLGSRQLYLPTGVTVDFLGNVFITDTGNDRVVKCDGEGRFLAEVGGFGEETGEFNRPTYITTDNGLNVYVVDAQNNRLQRFDHNLNFISTLQPQKEDFSHRFGMLEGIAITPSGEILVSDMEEDVILKLNSFYEYERSLGASGELLRDPSGVFVASNGNVFVADSQNDRVVIFNPFGEMIRSFGERDLKSPKGVAVGQDQLVYVANTGRNSVVLFDQKGQLIWEEDGSSGIPNLKMSRPTDLKLGRGDRLFVVDSGNNRILIFELLR